MTFTFGSAAPATGFGAAAAKPTGFSFGTPAATPAGTGGFGAPAAATSTPAFGGFGAAAAATTAAAPTLGGFGAAAAPAATATPAFGGFGAAATTAAAAPTLGGFGAPTATTSAAPAFGGFGAAAATTSAAPTLGGLGGFGAAKTTAAPAFGGFGAAATTSAPTLGGFGAATAATTTSTAPTLGGFGGFGAAKSTAATAFGGFGTAATSTTAATGGFGLSTTSAAAPAVTTSAPVGLGGNTTVPSFGLGGQTQPANQALSDQKTEVKNVKEAMIPAELGQTMDTIKKHIKDEKSVMSDISHISEKQYSKIQQETEALAQLVTLLTSGIHKNRSALENLKLASAQELINVEIAQRTKETPPSMQYENVAPMEYFVRLVLQFETDMGEYRKQIEQTQQHLQLMGSGGGGVTSSDISQAVQRLHAAFTELAARYQVIHQTLAACKEDFVAVHRRNTGTSVQGFARKSILLPRIEPSLSKLNGPSPFSAPADPLVQARAVIPNKNQPTAGPPTLGLNTTNPPSGAFGSFAGNQSFGTFGANNTAGNTTGFGGNTTGFGGNTTGFGGNTSGFGGNTTGFGGNTTGFGGNTTGFGTNNSTIFSGNTSGFGANTSAFGGSTSFGGFGNTSGFGSSTMIGANSNKRNKV